MAPHDLMLTANCRIEDGAVYKNGGLIADHPGLGTDELLAAVYRGLGITYPKFYKMDNLCKLGFLASEILLKDSFDNSQYAAEDVGIVLSNASSSLDADIKYWESARDVASPALFVYTLPNIVIGEIAIRNGFKGEHAFYITPQFDAHFIYQQVKYLLDTHLLKACICGWVEVIGDVYSARLFLVEHGTAGLVFSQEQM